MIKRKQILLLACSLFAAASLCAQENGKIESLKFDSKEMGHQREIFVYTPPFYEESFLSYFDVIYVFDAQNREFFDMTHSMVSFASNGGRRYIVVGIVSPYIEELDYARNNDLLPEPVNVDPKTFYGGYFGGADNLIRFVSKEVMPYMESNYRVKPTRVAVGHSLGASFSLYSFLQDPDLYSAFISVSPNFAYDRDRLADGFINFDFKNVGGDKFFYFSHADEGEDYWTEWLPAREKVYNFLESGTLPQNIQYGVGRFPDESHWSTFPPALFEGMKSYFSYPEQVPVPLSDRTYKVRISVTTPEADDEVWVTGNQPSLGDWQAEGIKMTRASDFKREITVEIHSPAELKFTRGSWETEALVKGLEYGMDNIWIDPSKSEVFDFEILTWSDRW